VLQAQILEGRSRPGMQGAAAGNSGEDVAPCPARIFLR
jgi:hypothetical protein